MRLLRLEVDNFRGLVDFKADIAPITLLTGKNSSGKSSLLYSLLGIMQSKMYPLSFATNGSFVQLGGFTNLLNDPQRPLTIRQKISTNRRKFEISSIWEGAENSSQGILIGASIKSNLTTFTAIKNKSNYTVAISANDLNRYSQLLGAASPFVSNVLGQLTQMVGSNNEEKKQLNTEINNKIESLKKLNKTAKGDIDYIKDYHSLPDTNIDFFPYLVPITEISRISNEIDDKVAYIGPFRSYPERHYFNEVKNTFKVGRFGDNHLNQILEWCMNNDTKHDKLNQYLQLLDLALSIQTTPLPGGLFQVQVKPFSKSKDVPLADIGFGLSQILPLLIADLQIGKKGLLLVSQPELHLHPSSQSRLGDYFCENYLKFDKSYLIETHSEYLINKFRILVAKGILKSTDVKIIHFENDGWHSSVYEIEFGAKGQLKNAPKDFFETYYVDSIELAKLAIK